MSMNNLTVDGEFRYITQWFNEFSELQRDDFVTILVDYLVKDTPDGVYMNGVVNSMLNANVHDKPMSLFQCRMKLFRQWTPKWPLEFKHKLKEKIIEMDTKVGEKLINELKERNKNHSNENGEYIDDDQNGTNEVEAKTTASALNMFESIDDPINTGRDDNPIVALNNDMPANDIVAQMPIVSFDNERNEPAEQVQFEEQPQENDSSVTVTQTVSNNV